MPQSILLNLMVLNLEIFIETIDEENLGMLMANSIIETIAACIYFDVDPLINQL